MPNLEMQVVSAEVMSLAEAEGTREAAEFCECCGCVVSWDDGCVEDERHEMPDGSVYCTESCAKQDGWERCEYCNEWVRLEAGGDALVVDGDVYCDSDCALEDGYECCEWCGEWGYGDDMLQLERHTWRHDEHHIVCGESCAERFGFVECDRCGEWCHEDDTYIIGGYWGDSWCECCAEDYSNYCSGCEERYPSDEGCWCDEEDEWYCNDCYDERVTAKLHPYGWTPALEFRDIGNTARGFYGKMFLGIELETDGGDDRDSYVDALAGIAQFDEHFWMTKDGSLDNGVEITGHPMTLAYHASKREMYESIRETALSHGYKSHEGGRCGLHIHVSTSFMGGNVRVNDYRWLNVARILQRFEREFTEFSRRNTSSNGNYWCSYSYSRDYVPPKRDGKVVESMKDTMERARMFKRNEKNHAQALNFQHDATREFRIFRGTLNVDTLFASMALVNGLCHVAKRTGKIYAEMVSWDKLIHDIIEAVDTEMPRECLVAYLEKKNLL